MAGGEEEVLDKYGASKEATARRFCELIETPSAAVFSKCGQFIYAVPGRGFPLSRSTAATPFSRAP